MVQQLIQEVEAEQQALVFDPLKDVYRLTDREVDIVALVAKGKTNREIANSLFITEKTVKAHLAMAFRKLRVENRTQCALAFWCAKFPEVARAYERGSLREEGDN